MQANPSSRSRLRKNLLTGAVLISLSFGLLVWLDINYVMPIKNLTIPNPDNDLSVFWTGARTVWQGGNPYDFSPGSLFHRIAGLAGGDSDIFLSPFYLSLVFMPLAILPLPLAGLTWLVLIQLMMGLTVAMLIRVSGQKLTPRRLMGCLGLAIAWRYAFEVMILNNLSLVMLFSIVVSYYCSRTGRPVWAGVSAAFLILKPQLVFLTLPLLLVVPTGDLPLFNGGNRWLAGNWLNRATLRRWAGFSGMLVIFAVYSFTVYPSWIGGWLKSSSSRYTAQFDTEMTSVRSLVAGLVRDSNLVSPVYLGVAGLGVIAWLAVWWHWRNEIERFPLLLAVTISINLLIAPYVRSYDFCILLVPLLLDYLLIRQRELAAERNGQKAGFHWSWLWWALIILPWPLHLLAINTGVFAIENSVNVALLIITVFVWRAQPPKAPAAANQTNSERP